MNKKTLLTVFVILAFVLSACAKAASPEESRTYDNYAASGISEEMAIMPEAPAAAYDSAATKADYSATSAGAPIKQMIIKNADLTVAVDDPGASMNDINEMATGLGGHIVTSYIYKAYTNTGLEVPEATITVRIPADKLDLAIEQIKNMSGDASKYTINESISGQDVTQEYTDLGSRLRNLEEADKKLSELYDMAEKTEDALAVYNQKIIITEQIEVIKGQMQYYEQSAAMSAISVRLVAKETIAPVTIAGWEPKGVARDAVQSLINFGKGLVEFLIWLVILVLPIIIVIGAPIFFFVRWLIKRGKRKEAARQQALRDAMASQTPPEMKK
ncbi:MAG: hypothetical protein CVU42_09735 [Chloroflexi bacterium HGW-Chloroflexi-4]|jgi:hypothetical protein|nr:MAG: hypothetical protein CVU42_09735 [Chloroflexi bacterium HGW-Chloroflexi-4]